MRCDLPRTGTRATWVARPSRCGLAGCVHAPVGRRRRGSARAGGPRATRHRRLPDRPRLRRPRRLVAGVSRARRPGRRRPGGPLRVLAQHDPHARERDCPEQRLARADGAAARRAGPRLRRARLSAGRSGVRHCSTAATPLAAHAISPDAHAIGVRFADPELTALGLLGQGEALIEHGDIDAGTRLLDEAMVAAIAGEVSPIAAGILYCASVIAANRAFDLRRVHEWTIALDRWSGVAARSRAVPRPVPRPPLRDQDAPRRVARGARGGTTSL